MKRETHKEPARSKKRPPLFKVRQNFRVKSVSLQADQAIKHISESLLSRKNISAVMEGVGLEGGSDKKRERQTGKQREREREEEKLFFLSRLLFLAPIFVMRIDQ